MTVSYRGGRDDHWRVAAPDVNGVREASQIDFFHWQVLRPGPSATSCAQTLPWRVLCVERLASLSASDSRADSWAPLGAEGPAGHERSGLGPGPQVDFLDVTGLSLGGSVGRGPLRKVLVRSVWCPRLSEVDKRRARVRRGVPRSPRHLNQRCAGGALVSSHALSTISPNGPRSRGHRGSSGDGVFSGCSAAVPQIQRQKACPTSATLEKREPNHAS